MQQLIMYEEELFGCKSIDIEKYRANRCADPIEYIIPTEKKENDVDKVDKGSKK